MSDNLNLIFRPNSFSFGQEISYPKITGSEKLFSG